MLSNDCPSIDPLASQISFYLISLTVWGLAFIHTISFAKLHSSKNWIRVILNPSNSGMTLSVPFEEMVGTSLAIFTAIEFCEAIDKGHLNYQMNKIYSKFGVHLHLDLLFFPLPPQPIDLAGEGLLPPWWCQCVIHPSANASSIPYSHRVMPVERGKPIRQTTWDKSLLGKPAPGGRCYWNNSIWMSR